MAAISDAWLGWIIVGSSFDGQANTRQHHSSYVVSVATARGVVITTSTVSLSNAATCGGASGVSQVSISQKFTTVVLALLTALASGFTVPTTTCFPDNG